MNGYGDFGEPRMTIRELANRNLVCGALPLLSCKEGCGARDWRAFEVGISDDARLLVCQQCGGECLAQFSVSLELSEGNQDGPSDFFRSSI